MNAVILFGKLFIPAIPFLLGLWLYNCATRRQSHMPDVGDLQDLKDWYWSKIRRQLWVQGDYKLKMSSIAWELQDRSNNILRIIPFPLLPKDLESIVDFVELSDNFKPRPFKPEYLVDFDFTGEYYYTEKGNDTVEWRNGVFTIYHYQDIVFRFKNPSLSLVEFVCRDLGLRLEFEQRVAA